MQQWWIDHGLLLTGAMLAIALAGSAFVLVVLRRLPADYFVKPSHPLPGQSVLGMIRSVIRNALGFSLLILGLFMSLPLVPGPGVLAILLGFSLTSFPGKRRLEIWILRLPHLLRWINRLRRNSGHPPLLLPSPQGDHLNPKRPRTDSHQL